MARHFRIALCGLRVDNLGDVVIFDNARVLLRDVLADLRLENVTVVPVDIGAVSVRNAVHAGAVARAVAGRRLGVKRKLSEFVCALSKASPTFGALPAMTCPLLRILWHRSPAYAQYAATERHKLEGVDLIVFAGGGLIKFHRQGFHYWIDDITALAQRRGIPVVFNAVGVEGYDPKNPECILLTKALKRPCVKSITTRDDDALLRDGYGLRPPLPIRAVCDPAFWTPETYGVRRMAKEPLTIGLNVIRPAIFGEYGEPIDQQQFRDMYVRLAERIVSSGCNVEFFTNGAAADNAFLDELFAAHPHWNDDVRISRLKPASARDLVEAIAGYERMLAVRLHASIVATVLGVPNVSLVWNRKQRFFGRCVGLPENYLERERFTADDVCAALASARPYVMDDAYKSTVRDTLREAVGFALRGEGDR